MLVLAAGLSVAPAPGLAVPAAAERAPAARRLIVVCSPGSPGTTELARPVMDGFSRSVERATGWPASSIGAIYFETEPGGLTELARRESAAALVPLPFLLKHGPALGLRPRLQVVTESGATEIWSLVAGRGRIASAADLAGWELTGSPGYAPEFVRGALLGGWGALPDTARVTFSPGALSALRRAATQEPLAVLLDAAQASALRSLPFAGDLEVVARSAPLPGTLFCTVGERLPDLETRALVRALTHLHESPAGAEALKALRMVRFEPADLAGIEAARRSCAAVRPSPAAAGNR
jgi:phosphonate ABC transporter substrate-binding protein